MIEIKEEINGSQKNKKSISDYMRNLLFENMVPLLFIIMCLIGIKLSQLPIPFILNELVTRLSRNVFVVLALIIPVLAGMGLNFAIVLGAMAGQIAIIAVTHWQVGGLPGLLLTAAITAPFAILFGYLTGVLLNKTKGQEMVTSMILGFFANGIYQLIFLFLVGVIIPMKNPVLVISGGVGIKNTIDLVGIKYSLDNIIKLNMFQALLLFGCCYAVLLAGYTIYKFGIKKVRPVNKTKLLIHLTLAVGMIAMGAAMMNAVSIYKIVTIPVVTFVVIGMLCVFNVFIVKTKLGQEFRTVGQDMHIAKVSGIYVDKVRIIAIVISTLLAGWGQIIFLQNLGTLNTYGSHEQVGTFAAAAILIGGASVTRATIGHAIVGTLLFHTLFIVSPLAGKNLLGSAEIGEYFRAFVAYGVIGVSLGLHAWKNQVSARRKAK